MLRKPAGFVLAVDQPAIDLHIENAASALDEFSLKTGPFSNRIRQTDGCWRVVSLYAVRDRNIHVSRLLLLVSLIGDSRSRDARATGFSCMLRTKRDTVAAGAFRMAHTTPSIGPGHSCRCAGLPVRQGQGS